MSITPDPADPGAVLLLVKAVPGARRDEIAGALGERLKLRVSAPPEGGKANDAIARLIARALGLHARDVQIVRGHSSPEKTLRIANISVADACARLLDA